MSSVLRDRQVGALYGMMIGDALAMPVHWYYDRVALRRDYGEICEFQRPRNPHPDSILWRSSYRAPTPKADILHDQAAFWGKRGVHYHQFLTAGENTLTGQLGQELLASLLARQGYDQASYAERYIAFMTEPGRHRDTYVEECHRGFFANFARGVEPARCAVQEKHIGGLVGLIPIAVWYAADPAKAERMAVQHVSFTHAGERMAHAARLLTRLLVEVLGGRSLAETLRSSMDRQDSPLLGHPFERWVSLPDECVIGRHLSPACYLEDAVPATLFLAMKYHDQPEKALLVNTNLGGDNVHRGAVLGALLGAEHGRNGFPQRWRDGLKCRALLEQWSGPVHEEMAADV